MAWNFYPYDQKTLYLLPPSVEEWVPKKSLARFVNDVLDRLEAQGRLKSLYKSYRRDGWGATAYHPRMLMKVLVYGYCVGVTSSRKLAAALENDVALRYLAANQQPDFRTVALFRKNHLEELNALFGEILELCKEAGLVKLGRVALDGRKVAGNAAMDQNRTESGLREVAKKLLEEAERVDEEEDRLYGPDVRGDELPEELTDPKTRQERIEAAIRQLEEKKKQQEAQQAQKLAKREAEEAETGKKSRGRKPKDPKAVVNEEAKANMTDPDSRILKTRRGFTQGYNAQAIAECGSQVIVAQAVTQEENDVRQLAPMLQNCEEQNGQAPEEVLADAGYWSDENAQLETEETELFIATKKDHKQRKAMKEAEAPKGRISNGATAKERMERKLLTQRGRAAYKQRGATIEPVFGQMVMRNLKQFWLRGLKQVKVEWSLWCATHNLLKLWRSGWCPATE